MTIKLLTNILKTNKDFSLDMARLLILFDVYSKRKDDNFIHGITKVVKLDFLLRYPTALEKALKRKKRDTKLLKIKEYERHLVESTMIKFKFGPWDNRYWSILSTMESMDLISVMKIDNVTSFKITPLGEEVVQGLNNYEEFKDYFKRSITINSVFGGLTAKGLVQKVYELRPELRNMKFGEEIKA